MIASRLSALALVAAFGLTAAAQAQPAPAMADHHAADRAAMHEQMAQRHAMHIKALHDALNIRPDQDAAFSAFAESMNHHEDAEGPKHGDMAGDHAAMAAMTMPERLDRMAQRMDERAAHMREAFQRHAAAVRALYGVLDPAQRRTLDALPGLMGEEHGMDMGHGHGGEEHGEHH